MTKLNPKCIVCGSEIDGAHYNTPIGCHCIACWKRVPLRERRKLQKEAMDRMTNAGGGIQF